MAKKKAEETQIDPLLADGIDEEKVELPTEAQAPVEAPVEVKEQEVKQESPVEAPVEAFDPTKKVATEPARVLTDLEKEQKKHQDDLNRFKKEIAEEEKVSFYVPLEPGEEVGAVQPVSLNGISFTIKKGAMVEIPKSIAAVLAEKYKIEMSAGKEMLLERSESVENALS